MAYLTKTVDTVRKQENRALVATSDKRYFWATHFRLQPVIDAAKSLKRHEAGLLSYFAHRLTNAGAEGINSRIQAIRVAGRGYRNRKNFKTAIWFHLGDLQLYPIAP
jgi:transposase